MLLPPIQPRALRAAARLLRAWAGSVTRLADQAERRAAGRRSGDASDESPGRPAGAEPDTSAAPAADDAASGSARSAGPPTHWLARVRQAPPEQWLEMTRPNQPAGPDPQAAPRPSSSQADAQPPAVPPGNHEQPAERRLRRGRRLRARTAPSARSAEAGHSPATSQSTRQGTPGAGGMPRPIEGELPSTPRDTAPSASPAEGSGATEPPQPSASQAVRHPAETHAQDQAPSADPAHPRRGAGGAAGPVHSDDAGALRRSGQQPEHAAARWIDAARRWLLRDRAHPQETRGLPAAADDTGQASIAPSRPDRPDTGAPAALHSRELPRDHANSAVAFHRRQGTQQSERRAPRPWRLLQRSIPTAARTLSPTSDRLNAPAEATPAAASAKPPLGAPAHRTAAQVSMPAAWPDLPVSDTPYAPNDWGAANAAPPTSAAHTGDADGIRAARPANAGQRPADHLPDALAASIKQAVSEAVEQALGSADDRRWPELPRIERDERAAQPAADRRRAERLEREQRGMLWSEWPF